jgi:hypothetical protein
MYKQVSPIILWESFCDDERPVLKISIIFHKYPFINGSNYCLFTIEWSLATNFELWLQFLYHNIFFIDHQDFCSRDYDFHFTYWVHGDYSHVD